MVHIDTASAICTIRRSGPKKCEKYQIRDTKQMVRTCRSIEKQSRNQNTEDGSKWTAKDSNIKTERGETQDRRIGE